MIDIRTLPVVVDEPGSYRMRNGGKAIVHEIKPCGKEGVTAFEVKGNFFDPNKTYSKNHPGHFSIWHVSGRYNVFSESGRDLIEKLA